MAERTLKLTARIESQNPRHAQIGVFQNGGKAGVLCVDAEYAEEIAALLAVAPDLKAQRDGLLAALKNLHDSIVTFAESPAKFIVHENRVRQVVGDAYCEIARAETGADDGR